MRELTVTFAPEPGLTIAAGFNGGGFSFASFPSSGRDLVGSAYQLMLRDERFSGRLDR